jgi:hypothetical protein
MKLFLLKRFFIPYPARNIKRKSGIEDKADLRDR